MFHVLNNAIWLRLDRFPPAWDSAHHLTMSLRWLAFFKAPSQDGLLRLAAFSTSYPPAPYLAATPFLHLFGKEADVAILASGSLWMGVLLLSTYGIARQVHGRKSGILAAAIVGFYPLVIAMGRDFLLDLPLTAAVSLSLWMLLRSNRFDDRGRAVLLGLALGLGALVKLQFYFFLVAPMLAAILQIFRQGGWSRTRAVNFGLCLAAGGSLAATEYLFKLVFLPREFFTTAFFRGLSVGFAQAARHPSWRTLNGLIYYATSLPNYQISFFFLLLFLASLPVFFRVSKRGRLILCLAIAIPYILATLMPVKEQRITMPYLPVLAAITAIGIASIRWDMLRKAIILLVLGIGLLQFLANSYGLPQLPEYLRLRTILGEIAVFDQHHVRSPRDYHPQPDSWKHPEVLAAIQADAAARDIAPPIFVPVISNTMTYNPNTLNFYSVSESAGIEFLHVWSWFGEPPPLEPSYYSHLILQTGEVAFLESWDVPGIEKAKAFLSSHMAEFTPIFTTTLPDDSEILLFSREVTRAEK